MPDLKFKYRSEEQLFFLRRSHYHLDVPVIYSMEYRHNRIIRFLLDTGAYVTIINRETSLFLKLDALPVLIEDFPLTGLSGSIDASLIEIPGLVIGDRTLKSVKVAIPHEDTKYCILGLNVLEHFKYLLDSEHNKIYFTDNPNYKIPDELKCAEVLSYSSHN
ncbi:MAG: retroviral-like aspartic protease family protein [Oscillospiraceae bacterium]|nr:retroviral-like aspartic protease family protein [Oscillospiraceae bacterium]